MLDIKMIRTDGEKVKERIRKREMNLDSIVDEILDIDKKRRELTGEVESKKAEQNADSKKIPQLKKAGEDTAPLMERMKALSAEIKEGDAKLAELEEKQKDLLLSLPNLPDEDVCAGGKEQNQPIRYFKEQPKFDYEPKKPRGALRRPGDDRLPAGRKNRRSRLLAVPGLGLPFGMGAP